MLEFMFIIAVLAGCVNTKIIHGKRYLTTYGEPWPKPQTQFHGNAVYQIDPLNITFPVIKGANCALLKQTLRRYSTVIKRFYTTIIWYGGHAKLKLSKKRRQLPALRKLRVVLLGPCESFPHFNMTERYELTISKTALLESDSIWGIMRGMETFCQLIFYSESYSGFLIRSTGIVDYPRYPHRGLLLDTSRHYISVKNIMKTLDAMAMNKMNVFHWHIVDDESFPYQSRRFPELSKKGAFHKYMVYTKDAVQNIVSYAAERGIRVIPEFNVPGHTTSWGASHPELLIECQESNWQLNPVKNTTYKFLHELFHEMQRRFPDKFLHIGGDEVTTECWSSNCEIKKYMKQHKMNINEIIDMFFSRIISSLAQGTQVVVWQDAFDSGAILPNSTTVQIWRDMSGKTLSQLLDRGHRMIYSARWHLDDKDQDFGTFYTVDPRNMVLGSWKNPVFKENIIGGEACMWTDMVDDSNVLSRIWPQTSAVAEVLWSSEAEDSVLRIPYGRLAEHTCRMLRRGIPAQPFSGPGFCIV